MAEAEAQSFIFFEAGQELMALPLGVIREVVLPASPVKIPRPPFACLGAMDLRGERMPLVALGTLLALEAMPRAEVLEHRLVDGHVLVVDSQGLSSALLVDRVIEITELGSTGIEKQKLDQPGLGPAAQFVAGTADYGEQRAWVLDAARLFQRGRRKLMQRVAEQK